MALAIVGFWFMTLVYAVDDNRIQIPQHDDDTLRFKVQQLTTENKLYKTEMQLMAEKIRQLEAKFDREFSRHKNEGELNIIVS